MFTKRNILNLILMILISGCTVNFKAEKLEYDGKIEKPGLDLKLPLTVPDVNSISVPFKISSITISNREEILWHLSNLVAALSKCLDQSPEIPLPATATEITSVHVRNQ